MQTEYVYFITDGRLYDCNRTICFKIGTTTNPIKRISDLDKQETFLSDKLQCLKVIKNDATLFEQKTLETFLHHKYHHNRVCKNREWFHFNDQEFKDFNLYIDELINNNPELTIYNYQKEYQEYIIKLQDNDILKYKDNIGEIDGAEYIKNRRILLINFLKENQDNTIKYIKQNFKFKDKKGILKNYTNSDIKYDMSYFTIIKSTC